MNKSFPRSKLLIAAVKSISIIFMMVLLVGCGTTTPIPVGSPTKTESPTPILPTSTPVTDSGIITPENVDHLVQIKQLGMGTLTGAPVYSADGQWLFLPTTVGVFILDTTSYKKSRFLISASRYTYSYPIDISQDGKTLLISSDLVNVDDGHLLPGLDIPPDFEHGDGVINTVSKAGFSPDDQLLALIYSGGKAGIWRLTDRKLLYTLQAESFDFSTDSRLMITTVDADTNPHIHLYETQTGKLLQDWAGERATFLQDNHLAVETNGAIRIYDLGTGKVPYAFNGKYAAFSPDEQLISFLSASQVEIRRIVDGKLLYKLDRDFEGADNLTMRFAPDGQTVAVRAYWSYCCAGYEGNLSLWRMTDGSLIKSASTVENFYFSPDSQSLLVAGSALQIWSTSNGSVSADVQGLTNQIADLAFLSNGEDLIAFNGGDDHPFLIYQAMGDQVRQLGLADLQTVQGFSINQLNNADVFTKYLLNKTDEEYLKALNFKIYKHDGYATNSVAFSPDNKLVATGSYYGGVLRLWNIAEQNMILEQTVCPEKRVTDLAFSPDGQSVASACADPIYEEHGEPNIQILQISPQGGRMMELSGYGYSMVAFSPDGRFLAAAGNHLKVWSAIDGKPLFSVDRDLFYGLDVQSIAFSPNGEVLAFGLKDGSVELWSVADGKQLSVLRMSEFNPLYTKTGYNPVYALAFSPNGKLLAVGFQDGSIRLWGVK